MKKLGIVGVGAIAQAYVEAIRDSGFARLEAVADIRAEAVAAVAETVGCKGFGNYEEMAAAAALDGVVVCTPPVTHAPIVKHYLKQGIPVLCEKPFALDEASAREMVAVGDETGTLVTMASKFRYVDDVIQARSIIASGLLGEIRLLENAFVSPVNMAGRWNSEPSISGGGVWIDNGTHSVDIIRYLLGPICDVQVVTETFDPRLKVEDNAVMFARTVGSARTRVDLSWTFDKQLDHYIRVYGTSGVLTVGWKGSHYKQTSSSDRVAFGSGYKKIGALQANLKNFCDAIGGQSAPLVSAEEALASVQVVQAGYASARRNGAVPVPGGDGRQAGAEYLRLVESAL